MIDAASILGLINQSLPAREAALLAGILVGDKSGFSKDFYNQLKNSGVVHLMVVSGSNVMLLASSLIENLAGRTGRKTAIIAGLGTVWWYAFLVGLAPPVIRAGLLVSIFYWAQLLGRKFDWGRGLGLAVGIMLLADWRMIGEISFWMTMIAFLAIKTRLPRFARNDMLMKMPVIRDFLMAGWVSLWLTPILGLAFGKISWVGPVTNAAVMLIVEGVTIVGGIGVILGSKWILWLTYPLLKYLAIIIEWGGGSWAVVNIRFNWMMLVGWYLILGYFVIRKKYKIHPNPPLRKGGNLPMTLPPLSKGGVGRDLD